MQIFPSRQQLSAPALLLFVVGTLAACGPTLRSKPGTARAYTSTRACSQGPFVVDLKATGARWGEQIVIQAWSQRAIAGRYDVTVDGKVVRTGRFGTSHYRYGGGGPQDTHHRWRSVTVKGPDNRRCVAAATAQPTTPGSTSGSDTGAGTGAGGPGAKPGAPANSPRAASGPASRQVILFKPLSPGEYSDRRYRRRSFLRHDLLDLSLGEVSPADYPFCNPSRQNEITKNTRIRIRLWSETPNDMEGAWIEVKQNTYQPSVTEAKYLAYLDKKKASCLKKAKRVAKKWERRARKRPRRKSIRRCRWLIKAQGALLPAHHKTRYMPCSCKYNSKTARCWGPAGYLGYVEKFRRELKQRTCSIQIAVTEGGKTVYQRRVDKPCGCAFNLADKRCWGAGGYKAFVGARWAKVQREEAKYKRKLQRQKLMTQPPPSPKAEKKSPRPSRNARWVSGYWVRIKSGRAAGRWGWIAGWWRVPPTDVKRGLTTRTRKRPPRQRTGVRRPPKPTVAAVWAPGYWHWTGSRHVWVQGAWRIPPRSRARWRPARWVRRGPFLILVPGGWIR